MCRKLKSEQRDLYDRLIALGTSRRRATELQNLMNHCREEESRTAILLGCGALEKLHNAHVAVFGVGGVGGHVCEALARAGVGALTLVDRDTVSLSNINRQIIALHSTVGRSKVEVMRERIVLYACINTLEYLYKGGRISHLSYTQGTLAQIKPIIHVDHHGRVDIPAKAMGMRKGMDYLCKQADAQKPDADFPLYVMYTDDRSVAETLAVRLAEHGHAIHEDHIIQVGAAIGSHVGPSACGLVYVGK
jgi:hypothetical protein